MSLSPSVVDKFKSLSPDKQKAALYKMKPETRKAMTAAMQGSAIGRFGRSAAEAALPSTTPSDYTFPLRHPLTTVENLPGVFKEMLAGPLREGSEAVKSIGRGEYSDAALHGIAAVPLIGQNLIREGEQVASGDYSGALGTAVGTEAGFAAPEIANEGLSRVGKLREAAGRTTQSVAQSLTGGSPEAVTKPLIEKYVKGTEKHAAKEKMANEKLADVNADIATKNEGKTQSFKEQASANAKQNLESEHTNARREAVRRSLDEGSAELGKRVNKLDSKLRQEANDKYAVVRKATAADPGVSAGDIAAEVRHAEQNILKGSTENIKQFRQLIGDAEEGGGIETSYGTIKPGDRGPLSTTPPLGGITRPELLEAPQTLYQRMVSQGVTDVGGAIPFDELQGYSSEIGARLASGDLHGDVYHALKYVKEKLDTAKATIAERNGAGPALKDADTFWRHYQDTFYDKDSAVAKVRESFGVHDPEYYSDAFTKGKAGDVGVSKLRTLPTKYASDAKAVADLASNLKDAKGELGKLPRKTLEPKEMPSAPKPGELKARTPNEPPKAPTVEDISKAKKDSIQSFGTKTRPYMVFGGAGSILSLLMGNTSAAEWAGRGVAGLLGVQKILSNEKVSSWLARPSPGDLKAIDAMPEPQKAVLRENLQKAIKANESKGIRVSPDLFRAAGITSVASGQVKNRQDALDLLQSVRE